MNRKNGTFGKKQKKKKKSHYRNRSKVAGFLLNFRLNNYILMFQNIVKAIRTVVVLRFLRD